VLKYMLCIDHHQAFDMETRISSFMKWLERIDRTNLKQKTQITLSFNNTTTLSDNQPHHWKMKKKI